MTIAELLGGEGTDPWTFSWWELEYRHTARVRRDLVDRYAPAGQAHSADQLVLSADIEGREFPLGGL